MSEQPDLQRCEKCGDNEGVDANGLCLSDNCLKIACECTFPVSTAPTKFKVGDRVKNRHATTQPEATVTEITERGFRYKYDEPWVMGTRIGTSEGGESFTDEGWELVSTTEAAKCELGEPMMHGPQPYRWCKTHNQLMLTCEAGEGQDSNNAAQNSGGVGDESPRPALEDCASCGEQPLVNSGKACCASKNCWLHTMMGSMSVALWNDTMRDLAVARVQQSASDMDHGD